MELVQELEKITNLLNQAIPRLKKRGREYAKAYRDYRVELAKQLLVYKAQGCPVTLCSDLARGEEKVADLKRLEIETETLYRSCLEAINVYKIQIKVIQEQIKKEYGQEN